MERHSDIPNELYFLAEGGEMGELIRQKDWTTTSLGNPIDWPQSLKTMVAMMLDNPFGMYIAWGQDYIQLYNDGYRPILGATKHPGALGISTRETFSEIWHIIGNMFDNVMKGKAIGFPDFMLPLDRNGFIEECYFDFSYSPIRKNNGDVGGVLVTVIETTNKKKTEDALVESEHRFRTMADNIPNLTWMANSEGDIFWYNKQWYEYTGTTPNQMQGWGWQQVHHPEVLPRVLEKWQYSINSGEPFEMVFPLRSASGEYRHFLTRVLPVRDGSGKILQWFGTNTDISDRLGAEGALKQSENNLRNTILQAPVAMCLFRGPNHIVELANNKMFELWGKPAEALMHKPIFEGLPEAKHQGLEALIDGVYHTGKTFAAEEVPVTLPRSDGTPLSYVNFVYEAFRQGDGTIDGILAVAVDVTAQVLARHKIEEVVSVRTRALETAKNFLQKSNEDLAQFAYIASHDLQEPLRKIMTFSDLLEQQKGTSLDEQTNKYVTKIRASASRMKQLVVDILAYSELDKQVEEFSKVDLHQIVEDVITDHELLIAQKGALITYTGLPVIEANPLQMSQLFGNLINNALKFSRPGHEPVINIQASKLIIKQDVALTADGEECYNIQINDNGIGLNADSVEKIFQIFQRLHNKSEYEGTGIGLAICKKIALRHHGDLNAAGSSENGAVFNLCLPSVQRR